MHSIKRYNALPDLRSGYALEDLSVVADGTAHALSSFGFFMLGLDGLGVAPVNQRVDEFTLRRGGQYEGYRVPSRVLTIAGRFLGDDPFQVDREMTRLARLIVGRQVHLRSTEQERQIAVRYVDGLTGNQERRNGVDVVLRFVADWPFWEALTSTTQSISADGTTNVVYGGSAPGYPKITFFGEAADPRVKGVANLTHNGKLEFANTWECRTDEIIVFDFSDPSLLSVIRVFVPSNSIDDLTDRLDIATARIAAMALLPGTNVMSTDSEVVGAAQIEYTEQYWGIEG